jgi:hypothetical protein
VENKETPQINGVTIARPIAGEIATQRTTSSYTTRSEADSTSGNIMGSTQAVNAPSASTPGGWGSYENPSGGFTNGAPTGAESVGFGSGGDESIDPTPRTARSLGGGRTSNRGVEETVTITILPEKEGMFMFQHRNYEVKSARRGSTVIRRYSDFVWLLDCLHKRYPFRQLPLLPPKRVAGKCLFMIGSAEFRLTLHSEWPAFILRCNLHREAPARACPIYKCSCSTSRSQSRTACCYVLDCPNCKYPYL